MFSIEFTDEPLEYPYDDTTIPAAPGRLILGNWLEGFLADLSLWEKQDYLSHWHRELKALFDGSPKVALIVSCADPKVTSNIEIWRAYREDELVHFQNQLLWVDTLPDAFVMSELSRHIDDRQVITDEGNRISEWDVSLRDIELFLHKSGLI